MYSNAKRLKCDVTRQNIGKQVLTFSPIISHVEQVVVTQFITGLFSELLATFPVLPMTCWYYLIKPLINAFFSLKLISFRALLSQIC